MSNIEWGPEIKVNGERPAWLGDGDLCTIGMSDAPSGEPYPADHWAWSVITAIRLPSSHWAYIAINAGFEPWGGGDSAPEDWDGGEVLKRAGYVCLTKDPKGPDWQRGYAGNLDDMADLDIIGYRKKSEPQAGDTVTIQRLPEAEWDAMYRDYGTIEVLRSLGLIKPELTKAERIAAGTGIDLVTVERVLAAAS